MWQDEALCAQIDPEMWFPNRGEEGRARSAKAYCHTCPVIGPCLAYALARPGLLGIWGGTSDVERRLIRGSQQEAA